MTTPMTTTSGAPLQTQPFTTTPTLIPQLGPDGRWNGKIVKIEQVLLRGLGGGARLHLWIEPDPRPHNHPWEWIACKVIRGQYVAIEYHPNHRVRPVENWEGGDATQRMLSRVPQTAEEVASPKGSYTERKIMLLAGDPENLVDHETHHQITSIEPGTISVMSFGPVVGDGKQWGHLTKSGDAYVYELAQPMGSFVDALRHCNPHMRPEGWADPYEDMPVPNMQELMASVGV